MPAKQAETTDIEVTIIRETSPGEANSGAVLVTVDGRNRAWLPKIICDIEPIPGGNMHKITLPFNLALGKGLI